MSWRRHSNMSGFFSGYACGLALMGIVTVLVESLYPATQQGLSGTGLLGLTSLAVGLGATLHFEFGHRLKLEWIMTLILPALIDLAAFLLSLTWLVDVAKHLVYGLPPSPYTLASIFPRLLPTASLANCVAWGVYPYLALLED